MYILAILAGKLLIFLSKLVGTKGSSIPGKVALILYPNLLARLSSQIEGKKIAVCGTNGKTTTNNLINLVFQNSGRKVVCNKLGANMMNGIVTAFIDSSDLFGNINANLATIEVDEFWAPKVFKDLNPDVIVINNLFRDQLDRYGEIDIIVKVLQKAIAEYSNAQLILNADDPLVAYIGENSTQKKLGNCIYFSVLPENKSTTQSENLNNEFLDGKFCKNCGQQLNYEYRNYGQLGKYFCECGFKNPSANYIAQNLNTNETLSFEILNTQSQKIEKIHLNTFGIYNIYNILSAYAVVNSIKAIDESLNFQRNLESYKPQIGRMERFIYNNHEIILNLSKNPTGFNQALEVLKSDIDSKNLVLIINDNTQDGRDISWLWDVNFEKILDAGIQKITISGLRAWDAAVRIKYSGYDTNKIEVIENLEKIVKKAVSEINSKTYFLVNYTALFETQKILSNLCK